MPPPNSPRGASKTQFRQVDPDKYRATLRISRATNPSPPARPRRAVPTFTATQTTQTPMHRLYYTYMLVPRHIQACFYNQKSVPARVFARVPVRVLMKNGFGTEWRIRTHTNTHPAGPASRAGSAGQADRPAGTRPAPRLDRPAGQPGCTGRPASLGQPPGLPAGRPGRPAGRLDPLRQSTGRRFVRTAPLHQ